MSDPFERKQTIFDAGATKVSPITRSRAGEYPPCFDSSQQYKRWLVLNKFEPVLPRASFPREPNYCRDCTAAYQASAVARGVCLFPGVTFVEVEEEPVDGLPCGKETVGIE